MSLFCELDHYMISLYGVRQLQEVHGVSEVNSEPRQHKTGRKGRDVLPPYFFSIYGTHCFLIKLFLFHDLFCKPMFDVVYA